MSKLRDKEIFIFLDVLKFGLAMGLMCGLMCGLLIGTMIGMTRGLENGLEGGLVCGFGGGLLVSALTGFAGNLKTGLGMGLGIGFGFIPAWSLFITLGWAVATFGPLITLAVFSGVIGVTELPFIITRSVRQTS